MAIKCDCMNTANCGHLTIYKLAKNSVKCLKQPTRASELPNIAAPGDPQLQQDRLYNNYKLIDVRLDFDGPAAR